MGMFDIGGGGGEGGGAGGGIFGMLQQLLDPLGLIPAIKGELEKALHPEGSSGTTDVKGASEKMMEFVGAGKNIAGEFKSTEAEASHESETAATELSPGSEKSKSKGYADEDKAASERNSYPDSSEARGSSSYEANAGTVTCQTYAATVATRPYDTAEVSAMQTLLTNFDTVQRGWFADGDGLADYDNLKSIAEDEDQPAHLRRAAQWFIDHPDAYSQLVGLSGRTDGCFTAEGLNRYMQMRMGALSEPAPAPTGSQPQPTSSAATTSTTLPPNVTTLSPGGSRGPSKSIDDMLTRFDEKRGAMDAEMQALEERALNGDTKAQAQLSSMNRKYQDLMQLRQELYTLVSNISRIQHEMSMHSINNIR